MQVFAEDWIIDNPPDSQHPTEILTCDQHEITINLACKVLANHISGILADKGVEFVNGEVIYSAGTKARDIDTQPFMHTQT